LSKILEAAGARVAKHALVPLQAEFFMEQAMPKIKVWSLDERAGWGRTRRWTMLLASLLLLLAVSLLPGRSLAQETPKSRTASIDGVTIHYLEAGRGPVVVLLHGYTQTSHMWRPLMARLSATHRVIAPDLRGAGKSSKPEAGYDKVTMARDIRGLVQSLGVERVKIVGHDIGLMVAYAYAAQFPSDVQRIVLMDAFLPGIGDWRTVWLLRDLWHFHFYGPVPEQLVAGRERVYFEHFWNDFAADPKRSVPEADRRIYAAAYAQPGGMRAGFSYFKYFERDAEDFARLASQAKVEAPMLVLTGEKASGEFLIQQARLVATNVEGLVVKNSGHWLMEEAPQVVIPRLLEFLSDTPR
jgi:pimeloyl-ACP methyl ester carboxylesterase